MGSGASTNSSLYYSLVYFNNLLILKESSPKWRLMPISGGLRNTWVSSRICLEQLWYQRIKIPIFRKEITHSSPPKTFISLPTLSPFCWRHTIPQRTIWEEKSNHRVLSHRSIPLIQPAFQNNAIQFIYFDHASIAICLHNNPATGVRETANWYMNWWLMLGK